MWHFGPRIPLRPKRHFTDPLVAGRTTPSVGTKCCSGHLRSCSVNFVGRVCQCEILSPHGGHLRERLNDRSANRGCWISPCERACGCSRKRRCSGSQSSPRRANGSVERSHNRLERRRRETPSIIRVSSRSHRWNRLCSRPAVPSTRPYDGAEAVADTSARITQRHLAILRSRTKPNCSYSASGPV